MRRRITLVGGTDMNGDPVPLAIEGGGIRAGGFTAGAASTFTRPDNTTDYEANDVIGPTEAGLMAFTPTARRPGGSGLIASALLSIADPGAAGKEFRLWLFTDPVDPVADNAPFPLRAVDVAKSVGGIDLYAETGGTGSDCAVAIATGINLPYVCAAESQSLYGILIVKSAWQPAAGETAVSINLGLLND